LVFAFTYFLRVPKGFVAVDMGWESDECWNAFREGLGRAGGSLDTLVGVVVTHVHPDHYGLAERIREHTSAWIAVHPAERPQIADSLRARTDHIDRMADWLGACGAPASELDALRADSADIAARISMVEPDHDLVDSQPVPDTDGALIALHTPGHTPGHLCFHHREHNLLFTGDHVLPRVTPNISKRPTSEPDPLADFIVSVDRIREFSDALVLPGHEWVFDRLGDRLDDLRLHHEERLVGMEDAVRGGASTVWEVAQVVGWSRPFESLEGRARRSAIGETYSHLYRLSEAGRLHRKDGDPVRWSLASD
jgi:glyoxylase-like metal-dependent hydrolase (beta-lactamase superfamily II)